MSASIYLQQALHLLCEWVVSFGLAFWIAQSWKQNPAPLMARLVRHPRRFWFAIAFGVAPPILSLLLQGAFMKLYETEAWRPARMPISFLLSGIFGALVGLAASCCAAPSVPEKPFRLGLAGGISAALIIPAYVLGSFLLFQPLIHLAGEIILAVAVLFVARAWMGEAAAPSADSVNAAPPVRRSPALALILGFLPSALVLATIGVAASTNLSKQDSDALLWLCSIVSVFCCFGASIVLFRRNTGGALAGGILLMLLNGFIAFFFGCCASINLSNMH